MLESAESLLNQDIEEELELLARDPYVPLVNPKKYGKAKALFEKVLSQGPDNKRAKVGLSACDEMLEPYILVQYMEPPDEVIGDPSPFEKGLKPWESRCRMRLRDRRGLDFTSRAFAEEEAWARSEALKMVEEAKKEVEEGGEPMEVYRLTLEKLEAFQERLHRGWKGHGPDILEFSITALKDALSSKELAKPKKPEDQRGTDVWMRDWKPETGYELRACVACGSLEVLPIFYISYEGEGIAFQQSLLYKCPACGRGIIQRLDYDSFDWESVFAQYEWYILGRPELEELSQGLKGCRRPASPKCSCAIHRSLRSSLGGLPRSTWEWAFEDDRHIHKVSLEWEDGLPKLTVLGSFSP